LHILRAAGCKVTSRLKIFCAAVCSNCFRVDWKFLLLQKFNNVQVIWRESWWSLY